MKLINKMLIIFMMVLVIIVLISMTLGLTKLKFYNQYLQSENHQKEQKIKYLEANQVELYEIIDKLTDTKKQENSCKMK